MGEPEGDKNGRSQEVIQIHRRAHQTSFERRRLDSARKRSTTLFQGRNSLAGLVYTGIAQTRSSLSANNRERTRNRFSGRSSGSVVSWQSAGGKKHGGIPPGKESGHAGRGRIQAL